MITRKGFLKTAGLTLLGAELINSKPVFAEINQEKTDTEKIKSIRVIAWNVACGQWATTKQIAEALKSLRPDLVLLNEVPKFNEGVSTPDWSAEVARELGLEHFYVGSISSAHHRAPDWGDVTGNYGGKFKSILSRWRISNTHDYELKGSGWSPASAVRSEVKINGDAWAIYSLHIPGRKEWQDSMHQALAEKVIAKEPLKNVIVGGDFNVRTDSKVLNKFQTITGLTNAVKEKSIDHIFYKSEKPVAVNAVLRSWGPKIKSKTGYLSDHPFVYAEFEPS